MKIGQVFKKTPTKENGGNLFGVPLGRISDGESLPKPVMVSTLNLQIANTFDIISKIRQFYNENSRDKNHVLSL